MDKKPSEILFYLLRLIGDIILIASIQTMFNKSMDLNSKERRSILISMMFLVVFNMIGIRRNCYTVVHYHNFQNEFFLIIDMLQLLVSGIVWYSVANNVEINKLTRNIGLVFCAIFVAANVYLFVKNFGWREQEGDLVFIGWFINNAAHFIAYGVLGYLLARIKYKYDNLFKK